MLPRHNRAAATTHDGRRGVFAQWIRTTWSDILTLAIFGAITMGFHHLPLAAIRTFPVTFNGSGDIVYPEMAYPNRGWIIETWLSGVLSALVPIFFILLAQFRVRSLSDCTTAVTGVLYADILGTLFSVVTKKLVGGFRPYFLDVCKPDISRATPGDGSLNGSGFMQIMYTVDICTTTEKKKLESAMTSFPSGHAVAAFAGFGFLFLYTNAKLKVWGNHRPAMWKLALLFAPILGAFLIACSLSIDAAHNWYDIVAGATIGTVFAFATYRMSYAAVWDWRFNHIPLARREFVYTDPWARHGVFTRTAGWGRAVSEKRAEMVTPRSSATIPNGHHVPRDVHHHRGHRGEQMV